MKSILIFLQLFVFLSSSRAAENCKLIYKSPVFSLCAIFEPNLKLSPHKTFSIYSKTPTSKKLMLISYEVNLDSVANIQAISDTFYFYKAYFGGNSINNEYRHVLLILNNRILFKAGEFAGYEDIDSDGTKEFFIYNDEQGKSHSDDKYQKRKLFLKDGKLL